MEVTCHPYKLLACSCQGRSALLGLVDDVDCAVVEASAPDASSPATLKHLSSIPAFAYVAEGEACPTFAPGLPHELWGILEQLIVWACVCKQAHTRRIVQSVVAGQRLHIKRHSA